MARVRYTFKEIVEMADEYIRMAREAENNHPLRRFTEMAPANDSNESIR